MVYFLYGEDSFRALEFVKDIFKDNKVKKISFEDFVLKDILSEICSSSLFSDLSKENFFIRGETLKENLEIPKSVILDKNKKIVFYFEKINEIIIKKLDKEIKVKTFKPLKGIFVQKYIESYLKNKGIEFEVEVAKILSEFCKDDLWKMATEVEYILAYRGANKISVTDLQHLINKNLEQSAFAIIDNVINRNKKRAFQILNDLIYKNSEDEFKIVGAINWQISNLIIVKDLSLRKYSLPLIQKISGMNYWTVKKSLEQSARFNIESLKKWNLNLTKLHLNLRRLPVNCQAQIERFIYSLE